MGFLEKLFGTHTKAEMKQMEKEWAAFDKEQEEWRLEGAVDWDISVWHSSAILWYISNVT